GITVLLARLRPFPAGLRLELSLGLLRFLLGVRCLGAAAEESAEEAGLFFDCLLGFRRGPLEPVGLCVALDQVTGLGVGVDLCQLHLLALVIVRRLPGSDRFLLGNAGATSTTGAAASAAFRAGSEELAGLAFIDLRAR